MSSALSQWYNVHERITCRLPIVIICQLSLYVHCAQFWQVACVEHLSSLNLFFFGKASDVSVSEFCNLRLLPTGEVERLYPQEERCGYFPALYMKKWAVTRTFQQSLPQRQD
eukprot:1826857-Amphidinium_carterae.1